MGMEVCIKFDTQKESVEDLKKLVRSLQQMIEQREKGMRPEQVKIQDQNVQPSQRGTGQTAGGSRIVPYEDMTDTFSRIFSGKGI